MANVLAIALMALLPTSKRSCSPPQSASVRRSPPRGPSFRPRGQEPRRKRLGPSTGAEEAGGRARPEEQRPGNGPGEAKSPRLSNVRDGCERQPADSGAEGGGAEDGQHDEALRVDCHVSLVDHHRRRGVGARRPAALSGGGAPRDGGAGRVR